jgi:hypothetical protein
MSDIRAPFEVMMDKLFPAATVGKRASYCSPRQSAARRIACSP